MLIFNTCYVINGISQAVELSRLSIASTGTQVSSVDQVHMAEWKARGQS